jgi:hypothetical protein
MQASYVETMSHNLVQGSKALASAQDIATCKELLRKGSKSFFAASLLLPKRVREPMVPVYAFCRIADDVVDESNDANAVGSLRARLGSAYAGEPHDSPVDRAFADVARTHGVPREVMEALIEGFAWDAEGKRYETIGDLQAYCARVASTVGVVMSLLMGTRDPIALARANQDGTQTYQAMISGSNVSSMIAIWSFKRSLRFLRRAIWSMSAVALARAASVNAAIAASRSRCSVLSSSSVFRSSCSVILAPDSFIAAIAAPMQRCATRSRDALVDATHSFHAVAKRMLPCGSSQPHTDAPIYDPSGLCKLPSLWFFRTCGSAA